MGVWLLSSTRLFGGFRQKCVWLLLMCEGLFSLFIPKGYAVIAIFWLPTRALKKCIKLRILAKVFFAVVDESYTRGILTVLIKLGDHGSSLNIKLFAHLQSLIKHLRCYKERMQAFTLHPGNIYLLLTSPTA